ncbi:MAG TPA: DUF438 domain-containing protein [Firmicutes bacterium]|jgi:hypothetical protein|nr:DUF438 domain-containing protein [Bacillota bacterium]
MSELIDNRKHRQETLKGIIRDLHAGVDSKDIKARFGELLDQVGATEIADIEQSLINEGLPVEEVQKLCDVHVAVFKDSLDKQKATVDTKATQMDSVGGSLDPLREENKTISQLVLDIQQIITEISDADAGSNIEFLLTEWEGKHKELLDVDQHYSKKENILFPYLERYGISGPPSVMWGTHDDIRASLKEVSQILAHVEAKVASPQLSMEIGNLLLPTLNSVSEMVYKEENILFPLCLETFTEDEWKEIRVQLKDPMATMYKKKDSIASAALSGLGLPGIDLDVGVLTPEQINLMLTHLPIDLTFVDEKDEVAYFSLGPERFFERTRAVIGRKVQFCHPPTSMGVVERILEDFKSGRKDHADFWINAKGTMLYIRYFAVRDKVGTYKGTLEVTQNITEIQKLTGEKRIYDYEA